MSSRFRLPMHRIPVTLLILCLFVNACQSTFNQPTPAPTPIPSETPRQVILTLGSWRTEDVEQMNYILNKFHEYYPHIIIQYDPISAPEYDASLAAQLTAGEGPDLFYLRSYSVSRVLNEKGFLENLASLSLQDEFSSEMLSPWSAEDGQPYGVPFIATSHGIYYNVDLFQKLNIATPSTWEELLTTAQKIKDAGHIPFANASADTWTIAEIVFMNIAPNFIGGRQGRMAYLDGKRCFNDENMVAVYQAVKDLAPFLPENQAVLSYYDSQQLFLQGKTAMMLDGSWSIAFFDRSQPAFAWSVFAPPPPAGKPAYITFHLDAGIGLNAASRHKTEALLFLKWMTTSEFASLLGDQLPGFFTMRRQPTQLTNVHANTFLELNQSRSGADVRFAWEKLRDGTPDAYTLILEGAVAVLNNQKTPQEAADALQSGLERWYLPAQSCQK